jgi:glycosyltransferase involved in cell wall biosynthesis
MHLQIIVPCYNPPLGWEAALVERFLSFQKALRDTRRLDIGLVVVNDGSNIHGAELNFIRLRHLLPLVDIVSYPQNQGKGFALRRGVAYADADFYLVTDADFPYTLESMKEMVEQLIVHGGVVAGNRDASYYEKVPLFRKRLSKVFRWMLRNLLRQPIDDSQCGLKGFDNQGKAIFLQTTINRFLFDLEFLMLAKKQVEIRPVSVVLREGVKFNKVGWKVIATEASNLFRLMLRA